MPPEGFEGLFQLPQTGESRAKLLESIAAQYTPWQRAVYLTAELSPPHGSKEKPYNIDLQGTRGIGEPSPDIPFALSRIARGLRAGWNGVIYYAWGHNMESLPPRRSGATTFDIIMDEYTEREFEMNAHNNLVLIRDLKDYRNIRDLVESNGLIRVEPELDEDEMCVRLGSTIVP